jgi:hypothetical protein
MGIPRSDIKQTGRAAFEGSPAGSIYADRIKLSPVVV